MLKKYRITYELDDPNTTLLHKEIIRNKLCLRKIYEEWYSIFTDWYNRYPEEKHLEIGSGGGFLKDIFPDVITSDVLPLPEIDLVINAEQLPFEDNSLISISMVNVFHHIPRPWKFLKEACRCLKDGGRIMMIEPGFSAFATLIYTFFHHEPFDKKGKREIEAGKPLSNSNQAMTYIYFVRDKEWFHQTFPQLNIISFYHTLPFRYLLSGGVSRTPFISDNFVNFFKKIEDRITFLNPFLGMFNVVIIEKQETIKK